jgi:DNA-binding response OmpR family regulator
MPNKVLIIDDDVDTLRLVGLMLERQGYEIAAASSGEQGIEKARQEHPDVILLDIMMPGMDGYEVARRLRADAASKDTPILMFTAKSQLEDKVEGFEAGIDDYLTKPTNPAQLEKHLRQVLAHARDRQAPASAIREHGESVIVLAAHGGLGATTVAVNLAAGLHIRSGAEVILAELTPGQGTLALELGLPDQQALAELLRLRPEEITGERVRDALVDHSSGLRLLLASEDYRQVELLARNDQYEMLFDSLTSLGAFVVLDAGSAPPAWADKILPLCTHRIIVTDASPNSIARTRHLIDRLTGLGIEPSRITVVLNSRVQGEAHKPWTMVQQGLAHPISASLDPAPDLLSSAASRHLPALIASPDDVMSQELQKLADSLLPAA